MQETRWWRYLLSCGLLTVPILVWNAAFTRFLPPALGSMEFWRDIPPLVVHGENSLRFALVVLPFLMPLDVATIAERRRLALLVVGTLVYFAAWIPLIAVPQSGWSTSRLGFLASAYTPLIWLTGLGLVGRRLYIGWSYRWWVYVGLACGFVAFHVTHASIVYARNTRERAADPFVAVTHQTAAHRSTGAGIVGIVVRRKMIVSLSDQQEERREDCPRILQAVL